LRIADFRTRNSQLHFPWLATTQKRKESHAEGAEGKRREQRKK